MTHDDFDTRLMRHGGRLQRLLQTLYGDAAPWPAVEAAMRARHAERDADLRALDGERSAQPDWFVAPDVLGYKAYVAQFGGTIAGVVGHVDHLKSLGVRFLHLLSLLKARAGDSDGGFAVADYLTVEPALGHMDDVRALCPDLRAAGISLSVDFALNHTADDHAWALTAKAGDARYRDFYCVVNDPAEVADYEARVPQVFPVTAPGNFTFVPDVGHVWTSFYPFQWDLNWRNPDLFVAMADTLLHMANIGFEAFRLDSIAYIWKDPGTDCRNRPGAHVVTAALRAIVDIVCPGVLLLGEAVVPTRHVSAYFGTTEAPECHLLYNNSLMVAGWAAMAEGRADLVAAVARDSGLPTHACNWLSYARCHDDIGWGALLDDAGPARLQAVADHYNAHGGEAFQTPDTGGFAGTNGTLAALCGLGLDDDNTVFARIRLMQALMLACGGLATLYMGDEIGEPNDRSYLNDPDRAHDGRWLQRGAMDWNAKSPLARRISQSWSDLRTRRRHAGAPVVIDSGHPAMLVLHCGLDTVRLNFSAEPAGDLPPYGVDWP